MAIKKIPRFVFGDNQPDEKPKEYNYTYTVIYQTRGQHVLSIEYPAHRLPYLPRIGETIVLDINIFTQQEEKLFAYKVNDITSVIRNTRKKTLLIRTDVFIDVEPDATDDFVTVDSI